MDGKMHMNGSDVFDFVTQTMPFFIKQFPSQIGYVPHQQKHVDAKHTIRRSGDA